MIDFLQAVSARKITPLTWIWFQVPPLGVLMISGCSVDFFINILTHDPRVSERFL